MKPIRLDKFLADTGIGTRSQVKKYIQKKQVQVDGEIVCSPDYKISSPSVRVTYQGKLLTRPEEFEYYLFYKPSGCITAASDPRHQTVMDYFQGFRSDLFPVGRLDKDTEGLLLITNDGALAHDLLSPRKHVDKTYYARILGKAEEQDIQLLEQGIDIGEKRPSLPARLEILTVTRQENQWYSEINITIREGKYHQIKRMMHALGKEVLYLKRLSMGPLQLDTSLAPGQFRALTSAEIEQLKAAEHR